MSVTSAGALLRPQPPTVEPAPPRSRLKPLAHPVVLAMLATAALAALWMIAFPTAGTDLAAQIARADFAAHYPKSAYDFSWYGGIYPAGYSILAPFLFGFGGTRMVTAGAAVACAGLITLLFTRHDVSRPYLAAGWIALGLWTGLISGRATFTLGLAASVAAVVLIDTRWPALPVRLAGAAGLAALSSLFSPVAGVFTGVAAAAFLLTGQRRDGILLGVCAGLPLAVVGLLFGTGGVQTMEWFNAIPAMIVSVLVFLWVPRDWKAVRAGALVYTVGVLATWIVPTAMGSNVERLGMLLAGPLLVAAGTGDRRRALFVFGVVGAIVWQAVSPIRDLAHSDAPLTSPASTAPLIHELVQLHAGRARVEAVPQYGHWESQQLSATVPLARGWERQMDTVRNPLFYEGQLTPAAYHRWLSENAVHYVAISSAKPDYAAKTESDIVRAGQPWLIPVWHDADWQLYRVSGTSPLAEAPARVTATTPATISISMPSAGSTLVRVRWSRYLKATGGGTVRRAGDWTRLTVPHAGRYVLSASY
ncbi:MAG TPA: hypothetical protein VHX59_16590 [Mycobacteriales bacterium]|nr:hypothetical protein [Mycobacteriales bacterium]